MDQILKNDDVIDHRLKQFEIWSFSIAITIQFVLQHLQQHPHIGMIGKEFLQSLAHMAPRGGHLAVAPITLQADWLPLV
jgi:hypothetical protein